MLTRLKMSVNGVMVCEKSSRVHLIRTAGRIIEEGGTISGIRAMARTGRHFLDRLVFCTNRPVSMVRLSNRETISF